MRKGTTRELGHWGRGGHEPLAQHAKQNEEYACKRATIEYPDGNLTV